MIVAWENLRYEVEALFHQRHPLDPDATLARMWFGPGWLFYTPEDLETAREVEHATRAQRKRLGLCIRCKSPRVADSANYCEQHKIANRPSARKGRQVVRQIRNEGWMRDAEAKILENENATKQRRIENNMCPHHAEPLVPAKFVPISSTPRRVCPVFGCDFMKIGVG